MLKFVLGLVIDTNFQIVSLIVEVVDQFFFSFQELNKLILSVKFKSEKSSIVEVNISYFKV